VPDIVFPVVLSLAYTVLVFLIYGLILMSELRKKATFDTEPDIRKSDLVMINAPPLEETVKWHPVLHHIPVYDIVPLTALDGSVGLVVGVGAPIKTVPHPSPKFNIPEFVKSVNILSADGELWTDVPTIVLNVVSRRKDDKEKAV
jgi:hypothetical protein